MTVEDEALRYKRRKPLIYRHTVTSCKTPQL